MRTPQDLLNSNAAPDTELLAAGLESILLQLALSAAPSWLGEIGIVAESGGGVFHSCGSPQRTMSARAASAAATRPIGCDYLASLHAPDPSLCKEALG